VRQQHGPFVLAGDFNMTPWTDKLTGFTQATRLKRYSTFHFTWPLHARDITLLPFVAIDNCVARLRQHRDMGRPAAWL
jgi:endonuclease/exonuclease/phosphatase (EEP) superfamily protein YafD